MNKVVISIITPAFNCQDTIKKTFKSVISQTFLDWEWLIIDDCSSDSSIEVINDLIKNDDRIHLIKTDKNGGTSVARNIGLKNAKGRYITFLDSDDELDADYLKSQLVFIEKNGPIISSAYRRKAEHTCTDFFVPEFVDYKKALKGNPLSCLTTMYDRTVIGDVYFPENFDRPEDYVFWLDILKRGYIARGNQQVLATYNIRKGSRSSNKIKLIKNMFKVYHKTQHINWFKSWLYVIRWAFYGKKKYKNVK